MLDYQGIATNGDNSRPILQGASLMILEGNNSKYTIVH
jgi:hypothetical protein